MDYVIGFMKQCLDGITWGLSSTEQYITVNPDAESVKDGSKRLYADEVRRLLVELLTDYYPLEGISKLKEYREVLHARVEEYRKDDSLESTQKRYATQFVSGEIKRYSP